MIPFVEVPPDCALVPCEKGSTPTFVDISCQTPGQLEWLPDYGSVQFCDGVKWNDTTEPATAGSCAATDAGKIQLKNAVLAYCDGGDWISMKGPSLNAPCSKAGATQYVSGGGYFEYCDGTTWYKMKGGGTGGACGNYPTCAAYCAAHGKTGSCSGASGNCQCGAGTHTKCTPDCL